MQQHISWTRVAVVAVVVVVSDLFGLLPPTRGVLACTHAPLNIQRLRCSLQATRRAMPPLPQVLVLVHGSAVDVAWADASRRVGAILTAFYPGQMARSSSRAL